MSKNKNDKTITDKISETAIQGGIVLMAAAATLGLVEVPHDPEKRAVLPAQPLFAVSIEPVNHTGGDETRREREEVHPHYHGYSVSQRTPGRTGKA